MPVTGLPPRTLLICGATALVAGLVYLNALHNPFVYDDYHTVVANASIRSGASARAIVLHDITRPLVNISYAIDRAMWGARPFGFHATNVLLHMLNVILLFRLAWRLADDGEVGLEGQVGQVRRAGLEGQGGQDRRPAVAAFTASALFAVHPMMTEAVGYISGRSEVLCSTFFLLGLLCGLRRLRGGPATWAILTAALWGMAVATKETAAMFPFVLFACDWLLCGDRPACRPEAQRRRFMRLHLPLMGTAVAAGVARLVLLRVEYPGRVTIHWSYVLLELDVLRRYVWLLVRPSGQTIFHSVAAVSSLFDPRALFAAGALTLMLAIAWRLRTVERVASLGVVWFLLVLVPSAALAVLDQGEPMAEHRAYLASCGLFLAAGAGVGRLESWLARASARWLGAAALVLVLLSFSVETIVRNAVWSSPVTLWRESVDLAPTHYRPRLLLGEALQDAGRREEAIEQYRTAVRLRSTELDGYLKLGLCLAEMGRLDEARQVLREGMAQDPRNEPVRRALALLEKMGPA